MSITTQKSIVSTEAVFSKDNKQRYLLRKSWDKAKPKALIVLLYPGYSDCIICDTTTTLCVNQAATLGFGGIDIVNLFTTKWAKDNEAALMYFSDIINDQYIIASAKDCDTIILATGKGNNKNIIERKEQVLKLLEPYRDKTVTISDKDNTNSGFHPLSPRIRYGWNLVGISAENKTVD
jgi:hypothetical protein